MSPEIAALIAHRLAAPKQFAVVTTFADGTTRQFEHETRGQADNYAVRESRKVGRVLLNRDTGAEVRIVSVDVVGL